MSEEYEEARWFDGSTVATRPGNVAISHQKLEWFRRKLNWGHRLLGVGQVPRERWASHLAKGLAEPALVVERKPSLLVAAYTDEFDCVVMLRFREGLPVAMDLKEGDRLLSVNTFERPPAETQRVAIERDLVRGDVPASVWFNVHPAIADFLSDDVGALQSKKREIAAEEWTRAAHLALAYRTRFPRRWRQGNPYLSNMPSRG